METHWTFADVEMLPGLFHITLNHQRKEFPMAKKKEKEKKCKEKKCKEKKKKTKKGKKKK